MNRRQLLQTGAAAALAPGLEAAQQKARRQAWAFCFGYIQAAIQMANSA